MESWNGLCWEKPEIPPRATPCMAGTPPTIPGGSSPALGTARDPGAATANLGIPAQAGIPSQDPSPISPFPVEPFPVSCPSRPCPQFQLSWSPCRDSEHPLGFSLLQGTFPALPAWLQNPGSISMTPLDSLQQLHVLLNLGSRAGAALQVGSHLSLGAQGHNSHLSLGSAHSSLIPNIPNPPPRAAPSPSFPSSLDLCPDRGLCPWPWCSISGFNFPFNSLIPCIFQLSALLASPFQEFPWPVCSLSFCFVPSFTDVCSLHSLKDCRFNQWKIIARIFFSLLLSPNLQAQQQRNLDNIVSQQPRISGGKKSKKEFSASSELEVKNTSPMSEQDSGILDVEDEDEEEEVPGAQDLVDFSPVYRCLHIYSVLDPGEGQGWVGRGLLQPLSLPPTQSLLHFISCFWYRGDVYSQQRGFSFLIPAFPC
uniref:Uncharacterized protein n=1 Tax=Ficedula albicollis TaxID=59894 RepID=A0A803VVQ5_FICAL